MTSMTRRGFATLSGLAMASIAAGCGRSSSPQAASTTGAKIKQGKATGNLTIWAMGAEEGRLPHCSRNSRLRTLTATSL